MLQELERGEGEVHSLAEEAAALPARLQLAAQAAGLAEREHAAASQALQVRRRDSPEPICQHI